MGIQSKGKPVVISAESYAKRNIFKYSILNPKILGMLTVLLLMVVGVGAGVYLTQTQTQTQTQATLQASEVSFKPAEIITEQGRDFSVDVFGNANGNQITSSEIAIQYDPEVLDLISITPREFLPKILRQPVIASGSASITLGTDATSGISGSGLLSTLIFKAKKPGQSEIKFDPSTTKINVLGNTANPLNNLQSAKLTINPSFKAEEKIASPSAQVAPKPIIESTSEAVPAIPIGSDFDFNSDSNINSIDLSVIYSAWGTTPQTPTQKKADLNGDGAINGLDYALFIPHLDK